MGSPQIGCSGFGVFERIRVDFPAARMTAAVGGNDVASSGGSPDAWGAAEPASGAPEGSGIRQYSVFLVRFPGVSIVARPQSGVSRVRVGITRRPARHHAGRLIIGCEAERVK